VNRIREWLRPAYHAARDGAGDLGFWVRRKAAKLRHAPGSAGQHFAILCVKRTEYVALAVRNINSLHLQNAGNRVTVFADRRCADALDRVHRRLDYPRQVDVVDRFGNDSRPWQLLKVEALMEAAREGWILVDADTIWHDQPVVDPQRITFLVRAYDFGEVAAERAFLATWRRLDLLEAPHFVTGFMSIPSRCYSDALRASCLEWTARVFEDPKLKRISEEIGVNIALQSAFPREQITTLKASDGPNDKAIMQSLYYGCTNQIEE